VPTQWDPSVGPQLLPEHRCVNDTATGPFGAPYRSLSQLSVGWRAHKLLADLLEKEGMGQQYQPFYTQCYSLVPAVMTLRY